MALTSEQVLALVAKIENAADADKRLAALQVMEATLDGATEIPDSDAVIQILKVSIKNAHQAVSTAALAFLPSLFTSLAAPVIAHGRVLPSTITHVRAAVNHLMPILIEKLGDQKERVREASRKALTQLGSSAFIVSPPADPNAAGRKGKELETPLMVFERLMRDNALGAKAARIKEQATLILPALKIATEDRFPVRLLLASLVNLLSDADPSVREGSRAALIALFVNAPPGAKAGLKKELERQDVRKPLMDGIVKEVLAGPSAASRVVSMAAGTSHPTQAPAAAQRTVSVSALTGANAIAAGEDDVPDVYVLSKADLAGEFQDMMPFFEGRETEHNWLSREQSVLKIRGMLKTGAHVKYRPVFVEGIKTMNEGILKALVSLRTTMALHACSLLGELGRTIGDSLDSVAETFMSALLRLAALTKKIVAASTQAAAREYFIHVPFKHSFATLLNLTMQEKTPASRQAGLDHTCTLLQYQGTTKKHAMESHGSNTLLGQALKRAMSDQNKDVRAKVREVFWVYHALWPAQAQAMLETADAVSKKTILAAMPPPGTVLLLTPDKTSTSAFTQAAVAPVAGYHPPPSIAPAPTRKPAFTQSVGPGPASSVFDAGVAPKLRSVASVASSIDSATSASTPAVAPKRRAVGPSAALLAAKREATLRMRAEAAAEREREESFGAANSSTVSSQDVGDDSEGGNWMADFKTTSSKPVASVSRSAFMPTRPRTPPSGAAPVSASSIHVAPKSPPRYMSKYSHDAILASPPKKVSHMRSISQATDDGLPTKIPLPTSPTSPRMPGSPRLMSSPRIRGGSGLGIDSSRFPRPSTDLLALASEEDADATQLLMMPGPDASLDLMMFDSSTLSTTPAANHRDAEMSLSDFSNDADQTTVVKTPTVDQLEPVMSSLSISEDTVEPESQTEPQPEPQPELQPAEIEDADLTADMTEDADETAHMQPVEPPVESVDEAPQSDSTHGRDVEETVALQAHEATSTAAQLLNLLETPAAAAAAAAAASSPAPPVAADFEMTSTPRISQQSRQQAASPEVAISPDRSHSSGRGPGKRDSITSSPGSPVSRSQAGTPTSAARRSHLPRPVSMLHRGSSPLHTVANPRHGSTWSVDLNAGAEAALARLNGRGEALGSVGGSEGAGGDSRRSSLSSTASAQLGNPGRYAAIGPNGRYPPSRGGGGPGPGPVRAVSSVVANPPTNPSGEQAAIKSFLRRASRLEQGSPIKYKPEAIQWVAAIRDGTADLRTYKRLLKLTIEFRIGGGDGGGELVPGRDAGTRLSGYGSGALGLERMGDAELEEEEAGLRAWEEGNLFDELFVAICASLQAPAQNKDLRNACFALLHRLVENQFPLFTSTGRELDLLALLFQLRKEGVEGKETLAACEAIIISWSARTDAMLGLGAVINNLKMAADSVGWGGDKLPPSTNGNGNGADAGAQGPVVSGEDENTLRTLVMGLKVLERLLSRLPGEVIEEELSRATAFLSMTLHPQGDHKLRRAAMETLVAANKQINNAGTVFKLVGPLAPSQQDLLMYYFHKAGQQ
ncbi:unnamed protein product [Tilletia controversa]|nr:unnamed protein product [Tilletia controversa]CAD6913280.1 unnamed protein product [Tilletia controversa]CAD6971662.1 unnamed protein product [Tilletia controversa]CAD6976908.1 unnamed protein product [Tilletia controversa]